MIIEQCVVSGARLCSLQDDIVSTYNRLPAAVDQFRLRLRRHHWYMSTSLTHRFARHLETIVTRHRSTTSVYSLTFRARVTTPPQYGQNGMAHAAGASMLSPARGVFAGTRSVRVRHACGVRWAWRITAGLCVSIVLP